jgi:hypothetical protein
MKSIAPAILCCIGVSAYAQETTPKWDVSLPEPAAVETPAEPIEKPVPAPARIISSNTVQKQVTEPAPMNGVPAVTGKINVTMEVAEAVDLPIPQPLPPVLPTDPAVQATLQEFRETHEETKLVFLSASVYDKSRTLLRISPNGGAGDEVTAWSNLDFNYFRNFSTYCVHNADGATQEFYLLMGIDDIQTEVSQRLPERNDQHYQAPAIPVLPELAVSGPAFQVIAGNQDGPAMDTLEQLHDLFRKEGNNMIAAYTAQRQAEAERRAELLANPPKPADVKIRYRKGSAAGTEVSK